MAKQREKQRGGVTGKGFVVGDPRINPTKAGPQVGRRCGGSTASLATKKMRPN